MAFAHSKNSRIFMNERHVSGQINGWNVRHTRAYGTCTTILESGERYVPGLMTGSLGLAGPFDSAQYVDTEVIAALGAGVDNGLLITACPDTTALGSPAMFCPADPEGYVVAASVADTVTFSVEAVPDAMVDMGVVLHDHTAETADANTTSVDRGAGTTGGGAASLHVSAYTGLTNAVIKVQHSTNNSTWADLITFATVTAVGSEFKTVTGTVNRYVRVTTDVTGTGSVTFLVAFGPR